MDIPCKNNLATNSMARATIPCNESATKDVFSIPNADHFKCPICLDHFNHNEGVTLKNCLHIFCRKCLIDVIEYSQEAQMGCPFLSGHNKCGIFISESEIRALLPRHLYEAHLQKSLNLAELQIKNSVHCKTPNCIGWVISEDSCVNSFSCPICERHNCLSCMAVHDGINCQDYQNSARNTEEQEGVRRLEMMLAIGDAMRCPKCQIIITKIGGCDAMRCPMCATKLCWATRGPRWGPAGYGDISGGCKCYVNGVKCHPQCRGCH